MALLPIPRLVQNALNERMKNKKQKRGPIMMSVKAPAFSYRRDLNALIRAMSEDVRNTMYPLLIKLEPQYTADSYSDVLGAAFDELKDKYANINVLALRIATEFVMKTDFANRNRFYAAMNQAIGVNVQSIVQNEGLEPTITSAIRRNVALIKTIPVDYFNAIEQIVFTETVQGSTSRSMISQIMDVNDKNFNRAKVIARDQTSKLNGELSKARQENLGIEEYIWRTSEDGRVRDSHKRNNGKVFRWDTPPPETGHPGNDIQCFTGDMLVQSPSFINNLFRRWYSGEMVSMLTSASDKLVVCTPNHQFLTEKGWVSAKLLNVGDNIVSTSQEGVDIAKANINDMVPFQDLFRSFELFGNAESTRGASGQFHGDGSVNHDVDVIRVKSELRDNIETFVLENSDQLNFTIPDVATHCALASSRSMGSLGGGVISTSGGVIGGFDECFSLLRRRISHTLVHGLASAAHRDFTSFEHVGYSLTLDSCFIRKLFNAFTVQVISDRFFTVELYSVMRWFIFSRGYFVSGLSKSDAQVVGAAPQEFSRFGEGFPGVKHGFSAIKELGSVFFNGHVYNLENENNWYYTNGVANHNCRCVAIPLLQRNRIE